MKQIYLVLFAMCITSLGWAQTLNESFDGTTFPPTGWQNKQVSG